MSYTGISIREAMDKINRRDNGWFLPQTQRQYIWAERFESETYICLLLDSLYREYPIGGLVLWETDHRVPFREFVNDYYAGNFVKEAESGRWGHYKSLVYDGQQRLQSLRSVLLYTFNNRVLYFDLLFDRDNSEPDETGFFFLDKGKEAPSNCIKMTELSGTPCDPKEKALLDIKYTSGSNLIPEQELIVKTNIQALWDVFVGKNIKCIAYFSVETSNVDVVNEIFRRLNTGGIELTQIEMVLSKVKATYSDYEERLWEISSKITECTGGYKYASSEILQFFYLSVFGTIKVELDRVERKHVKMLETQMIELKPVIEEFFEGYLWGLLKINHKSIVPRPQALLPIAIYLANLKNQRKAYQIKKLDKENIQTIHQYFILSQFCDWNTQTMVNRFSAEAKNAGKNGNTFPLDAIRIIASQKNRLDTLTYYDFISKPWLALKILTPNRSYPFLGTKPQVDHIFPRQLEGEDRDYAVRVDVLWNLQPMPAGVNNYKRARHPKEFFTSKDGEKYFSEYNFLPALDTNIWDDEKEFIKYRKKQMIKALKGKYDLELKQLP